MYCIYPSIVFFVYSILFSISIFVSLSQSINIVCAHCNRLCFIFPYFRQTCCSGSLAPPSTDAYIYVCYILHKSKRIPVIN